MDNPVLEQIGSDERPWSQFVEGLDLVDRVDRQHLNNFPNRCLSLTNRAQSRYLVDQQYRWCPEYLVYPREVNLDRVFMRISSLTNTYTFTFGSNVAG